MIQFIKDIGLIVFRKECNISAVKSVIMILNIVKYVISFLLPVITYVAYNTPITKYTIKMTVAIEVMCCLVQSLVLFVTIVDVCSTLMMTKTNIML